jgi:transketolase
MRSLQNMAIVAPADRPESLRLARASYEYGGPLYIRLGRTNPPDVYDKSPSFTIGKAVVLSEGKAAAIFAIGDMVSVAKEAAALLLKKGVKVTVVNMHTLKPLDTETVRQAALKHDAIISVEEHNRRGGLGSAIGETLLEERYKGVFESIGLPDRMGKDIGDADHLRAVYGLTPENVCRRVLQAIQ